MGKRNERGSAGYSGRRDDQDDVKIYHAKENSGKNAQRSSAQPQEPVYYAPEADYDWQAREAGSAWYGGETYSAPGSDGGYPVYGNAPAQTPGQQNSYQAPVQQNSYQTQQNPSRPVQQNSYQAPVQQNTSQAPVQQSRTSQRAQSTRQSRAAQKPRQSRKPSMAARAAGKQNLDPYGYSGRSAASERPRASAQGKRTRQQTQKQSYQQVYPPQERSGGYDYDYDTYEDQPRRRRRKKHHGFRNFLIFLLVVAALLAIAYVLLFPAPDQYTDGIHTRNKDVYNILLCATDEGGARTDTMMIATLNKGKGTVSLTTVPRDTIVNNGEAVPKLNGVYAIAGGGEAGAEALMDQLQPILGFRPDAYAIINYEAFRDAVNALGGVTFDVPMDMSDGETTIYAGEQELNGDQALFVCRFRYGYLMADIQRQYVQQTFVKAIVKECMKPENWIKLPGVYRAVMANTLTDLSDGNIRYLALHVLLTGTREIQQYTLPGEGVDYYGASCFGLFGQSVVDQVNETMNPYQEELTIDDVYILTVQDGELVVSTWTGEAFDPSTYDYDSYG